MEEGMEISTTMTQTDAARVKLEVDSFNKALGQGRSSQNTLDKDDFLKILITQLQNQDPTNPMEDKEFISQMAQFSTLEQMTNMTKGFGELSGLLNSSQATSMLGKTVAIQDGADTVYGVVKEVVRGEFPMVMVDNRYFDFEQIQKVLE
jgi:flagellar basal-body rod modification protein FlgD